MKIFQFIFVIGVLAFSTKPVHPGLRSHDLKSSEGREVISGVWQNDNPDTRNITKLIIWYNSNICSFQIHSYVACISNYCDWGVVSLRIKNNWKYSASYNLGNNSSIRIKNLQLFILNDKLTVTEVEGDNYNSAIKEGFHRAPDSGIPHSGLSFAPIGKVIMIRGNNGLFVSSENGNQAMNCNRVSPSTWEEFQVLSTGNDKIVLRNMQTYVSSENGEKAITCNRQSVTAWERFDWIPNCDGTFSLRGSNGRYVSSENGTQPMTCNRTIIGDWEKFRFQ